MTEQRRHAINGRLLQLATANGGALTADLVIADAQKPESPLHGEFDWNVASAAHSHWVTVANRLINAYTVTVTVDSVTLKAPVFLRSADDPKRFVRSESLATDRSVAREVLQREIARVRAAVGRMQAVASILELNDEIDVLQRQAQAVAEKVE